MIVSDFNIFLMYVESESHVEQLATLCKLWFVSYDIIALRP